MLLLYMSETLETFFKSLNLPSLKAIIRYHNQHEKIKMTGKKEQLIQLLLSKYDAVTDGQIKSKIFNTPTFDIKAAPKKVTEATEERKIGRAEREEEKRLYLLSDLRNRQITANLAARIAAKKKQPPIEILKLVPETMSKCHC